MFEPLLNDENGLFIYRMTHDTGNSPNPSWGFCTVTCCATHYRQVAKVGDWLMGISGSNLFGDKYYNNIFEHRIIYLMKVSRIMRWQQYCSSELYKINKNWRAKDSKGHIYEVYGDFTDSKNNNNNCCFCEDELDENNVTSDNVLISDYFYYFGRNAQIIPEKYKNLLPLDGNCRLTTSSTERTHFGIKNVDNQELARDFLRYILRTYSPGVHGIPFHCEI